MLRFCKISVCFLFLFSICFGSIASSAEVKAGDHAPDFKLVGSDGKTYNLKEMKGKTVVIAWFPKADTPGCTAECKSFKEDGKLLKEFDIAYFTASVDKPEENKKFAEKLSVDYPILSDPTKETAKAYGLLNEKKMANRVTVIIGADGRILEMIDKVDTKNHAKQVANKLKELKIPAKS